jgi:TRAP-type transport system small permease protein
MREPMTTGSLIKKIFQTGDKIVRAIVTWISIVCFILLFILVLVNVFIRKFPLFSLHFFDEIQVWLLGALVFYGAAGLWILRDHFKLDVLQKYLAKNRILAGLFDLFVELASMIFISIFTYECLDLSSRLMGETNYLRIPESLIYRSALLVPGVIMVVYSIRNIAMIVYRLVRPPAPVPGGTGTADPAPPTLENH